MISAHLPPNTGSQSGHTGHLSINERSGRPGWPSAPHTRQAGTGSGPAWFLLTRWAVVSDDQPTGHRQRSRPRSQLCKRLEGLEGYDPVSVQGPRARVRRSSQPQPHHRRGGRQHDDVKEPHTKSAGKWAPPSHRPSSSSSERSRAPHPSVSTFARCASQSELGASRRSRITCQRIDGSESSSQSRVSALGIGRSYPSIHRVGLEPSWDLVGGAVAAESRRVA